MNNDRFLTPRPTTPVTVKYVGGKTLKYVKPGQMYELVKDHTEATFYKCEYYTVDNVIERTANSVTFKYTGGLGYCDFIQLDKVILSADASDIDSVVFHVHTHFGVVNKTFSGGLEDAQRYMFFTLNHGSFVFCVREIHVTLYFSSPLPSISTVSPSLRFKRHFLNLDAVDDVLHYYPPHSVALSRVKNDPQSAYRATRKEDALDLFFSTDDS